MSDQPQPQQQQQPKPQGKKQQGGGGQKKSGAAQHAAAAAASAPVLTQPPSFWASRLQIFDKLYAEQQARYEAMKKPIKVTLPNGSVIDAEAFATTPLDIAAKISKSLAEKIIVAKIDGNQLWDLGRVLERDCNLELLDWEDPEAKEVFWHSSAHVLGYAMEKTLGVKLVTGPPIEEGGFFYEGESDRPVVESDYTHMNAAMSDLSKGKHRYLRLEVPKKEALEMFGYNSFKVRTLGTKVPEGGICTVYRCGDLIDPCRGPHVYDTGRIKAAAVTKNSSSYFRGDANNESLQRVYAIAFPKADQLKQWLHLQAEAAKRDHRRIGVQQELFMFHDVAPGTAFWLPHGCRIYNKLIEYQRAQYKRRGFEEVLSPNLYNAKLWQVSGHWDKYADCMFTLECEKEDYGLKPMNCPGHCIIFGMRARSYRELPIRMAEFGVLHRNELSGALSGLTRVRRFQQDDAHIFCSLDQIKEEIDGALDFLMDVYKTFGFTFHMKLSTRPESALGSKEVWDVAEEHLRNAMNGFSNIPEAVPDVTVKNDAAAADGSMPTFFYDGTLPSIKKMKRLKEVIEKKGPEAVGGYTGPKVEPWELNEGDGAFYGPKIDIVVEDALKRKHQLATIQLDFNLPERFGLKYTKATSSSPAAAAASSSSDTQPADADAAKQKQQNEARTALAAGGHDDCPACNDSGFNVNIHAKVKPQIAADNKSIGAVMNVNRPPPKVKEALHIDRSLAANQERPVMIHRAIFGSVERCVAILTEHYAGKWPLWLSPRQVCVIPVAKSFDDYANQPVVRFADEIATRLRGEGFFADADLAPNKLDKKILDAETAQYNFLFVVGEKELESQTVNVRSRGQGAESRHGTKTLDEVSAWLKQLCDEYSSQF